MKSISTYISEGGFFKNVNADIVTPKNKRELIDIINNTIAKEGPNCNLNFIDTSKVDDISALFCSTDFNGDISQWNISNVKNMAIFLTGTYRMWFTWIICFMAVNSMEISPNGMYVM